MSEKLDEIPEPFKGKLYRLLRLFELEAVACNEQANKAKAKGDGMNAYIMDTQALAHQLDAARLRDIFELPPPSQKGE